MARPRKYSPELRERAVRLVFEHAGEYPSQWAAIRSLAEKIGCANVVLRRWVRQAERDTGHRLGLTTDERQRLKQPRTRERRTEARQRDSVEGRPDSH
jgi:transposase